jgi:hypothetical protein
MNKQNTYEEFEAKYEPHMMANGILKEYHSHDTEDWETIQNADPRCVWTMVEGDDESWVIVAGLHYVNRIYYILTEQPWTAEEEYLFCD